MPLVPAWTTAVLAATTIVKHSVADFLLQTAWMARGRERRSGWLPPRAAHAGCHAAAPPGVARVIAPRPWWRAPVDGTIHFGVDQMPHGPTDIGLVATFLTL